MKLDTFLEKMIPHLHRDSVVKRLESKRVNKTLVSSFFCFVNYFEEKLGLEDTKDDQ